MTIQEEMDYEMRPRVRLQQRVFGILILHGARAAEALSGLTGYIVAIEPELFEKFPSSEAVNEALRSLLKRQEQDAA